MASVPFNNLITFSRGSNATLTGPTGLVQYAPNNSLTSSQSFTVSGWFVDGAVVTPYTGVAPDGTTTATSIAVGTGNNRVYQFDNSGILGNKVFSLYVKAGVGSTVTIGAVGAQSPSGTATVNASTGTVSGFAGASIVSVDSGWYRVSVPVNVNSASGNTTYWTIGATGGAVFIWGAQLELGSAATTYNSTTVKNVAGFSEAFDTAAWAKLNVSIVTGAQANPVNGSFNAQKLMENTASGEHYISLVSGTTAVGARTTISFYAKAAERNKVRIYNFAMNNLIVFFDLTNGVSTRTAGGTSPQHGTVDLGNGWYRCYVTDVPNVANQDFALNLISTGTVTSYTGDGNSGVYIYGAQVANSASLDLYVPTPAAAPSSTAYYGPRFDYDPVTLAPKGLLVEEARTNLFLYSEDFTNAAWTAFQATITANQGAAPDGTTTADNVTPTNVGGSNTQGLYRPSTPVANATAYTYTVYAKANGYGGLQMICHSLTSPTWAATFNLTTGQIVGKGASVTSQSITAVGNGWYRCSATVTSNSTLADIRLYVGPAGSMNADGSITIFSANGSSVLIYGAQLEAGAFATSYIPTVASTVTRSADVANMTGSLFSQWYGKTQGSFVFTGSWMKPSGGQIYVLSNGSSNRYIYDGNSAVLTTTGQSFDGTNVLASNVDVNGTLKIASAYQTGVGKAIAVNGSAVATGAYDAAAWSVNTALKFGETFYNGHIRSIDYIPARAADFQLQVLST